jgi:NADH-quinone oxidoreductase subunit L
MQTLALSIVLLPLLAALLGPLGYKLGERFTIHTTCGLVTLAAIFSLILFGNIGFGSTEPFEAELYRWFSVGGLDLSFGVLADKLSATMFVVVTVVSACVHWYSIGYMHDDKGKVRFFSYLSLFTFMMLALVSAPNLLQMFLGWEGVGLASYLLIGYYHQKNSANAASMKAFIVNRVADVGLLLALFVVFTNVGSLHYYDLFTSLGDLKNQAFIFFGTEWKLLDLMALLFFIGAMGKSAQLGFHTWLPDAMEGPTPVSALIHAATMVTAGVFLLARLSPLYELTPHILTIVAWVGALTALFAATIGLTQKDIKRVIAYSTCSQLGYMFFACGIGAYHAAMFHLTTHAFFKALLFLGAGSVIHRLHHEQDLSKMGGLRKPMLVTYVLMWLGSLALAGIPPFAGFFSKDLILEHAAASHTFTGNWLYIIGTVAALMTAFYSFRLLFLAFHGKTEMTKIAFRKVHESPMVMQIPMFVLAAGAVFAGFIFSGMGDVHWWHGAIVSDLPHHPHVSPFIKWLPLVVGLVGIALAWFIYIKRRGIGSAISTLLQPLSTLSERKWYIDEFYDWLIVQNVSRIASVCSTWGDQKIIDGLGPDGIAKLTNKAGLKARLAQTGYVYHYAFAVIVGIVLLIGWLIMRGGF